MTRKDTILIAVVINAGLLAILFTTAVIYDTDKEIEQNDFVTPISAPDNRIDPVDSSPTVIATASSGDEVDNVLKYYSQPNLQPIVERQSEVYAPEPIAIQSNAPDDEDFSQESGSAEQLDLVEIKVKKGDTLEKIARANKTTIGAIKRANHLENERLFIGQVLKIPVKQEGLSFAHTTSTKKVEAKQGLENKLPESNEPLYYVVKSGDNPWKIAKNFNVKYEEILRLNHLDEEKARNLKIGDRIRVK